MAKAKRALTWHDPTEEEIQHAFRGLSQDAQDYLEGIVTGDCYDEGSQRNTDFNLGARHMCMVILGFARNKPVPLKIIRNIPEDE